MEMIYAVTLLGGLTLALGWLLLSAHRRFKDDNSGLIDAINALLPQTQCAQCGYPGCRPYAEAVATGAAINLCPPGGRATFEALGGAAQAHRGDSTARTRTRRRTDQGRKTASAVFSASAPAPWTPSSAHPGSCTPSSKNECTGCELCLPPCPVDCIDLVPTAHTTKGTPTLKGTPTHPGDTHLGGHPPTHPRWGQHRGDTHPRYRGDTHPALGTALGTPAARANTPKGHPPKRHPSSPPKKGHPPPPWENPPWGHPPPPNPPRGHPPAP